MINDVWKSFRALPMWVQIWMALVLVPVNLLSVAFLGHPGGPVVATLAIGGMAPNLIIMAYERGLSKAMSFPHLALWVPLVLAILLTLPIAEGPYRSFLIILLIVDLVSLAFDIPDAIKWWRGERSVAGK